MANPTPKQQFQKIKGAISAHRDMVDSDEFHRAASHAERQYVARLCELAPGSIDSASNVQASAACFQRIMGVFEFMNTLRNLSENPPKPGQKEPTNLDHNA